MKTSRNTIQRDIILKEISDMHGHATADMIYESIHKSHPSISKATVYRNINVLEQENKIMRIEVADGADYFEKNTHAHDHIKCSCCGRIFDASLPYMPDLISMAQSADQHFEVSAYSLIFDGICPECKSAQKEDAQV